MDRRAARTLGLAAWPTRRRAADDGAEPMDRTVTVSVTRRIGRWRTAYLVLSGRVIDATTALAWGLVDEIG